MHKIIVILTLLASLALPAAAQRGAGTDVPASTSEKTPSNTQGRGKLLRSHIKSLGTIGANGRYEINTLKIRGLDTPNLVSAIVYDKATDSILVVGPASSPGLGVAIVNGAASVGTGFLFGSSLRPDKTSVNNNSDSDSSASGGNSSATGGNATAKGGKGGNASSVNNNDSSAISKSRSSSSSRNTNVNSNSNSNNNRIDVVVPPAPKPPSKPSKPSKPKKHHGSDDDDD